MKQIHILAILLCLFAASSYAQEVKISHDRYVNNLTPSFGVNLPITKMDNGEPSSHLLHFNDNSYYHELLSGYQLFSKSWGIEYRIKMVYNNLNSTPNYRFHKGLVDEYSDQYYVQSYSDLKRDNFFDQAQFFVGLVNYQSYKRFSLLTKLSFGLNEIKRGHAWYELKEKEAHNFIRVEYKPERDTENYIVIAPSINLGYDISEIVALNFNCGYSYFRSSFRFYKITSHSTDGTREHSFDSYRKDIHQLSLGVGVTIRLSPMDYLE